MLEEKYYAVILLILLALGICLTISGIVLRKRMRTEFVYLCVVGGILFDFVVLLGAGVLGIILVK